MQLRTDDRVSVRLTPKVGPDEDRAGTVVAFDLDGHPKGVLIRLDRKFEGMWTVYLPRDASFASAGVRVRS